MPNNPAKLKPGSANAYKYPDALLPPYPWAEPLPENEERILHELILALARGEGAPVNAAGEPEASSESFLEVLDGAGANVTLGLLVANTDAAVALVVAICKARPAALTISHGPGPFTGENALHVLMVNRREAAALELVELALEMLSRKQLEELFYSQASGPFFHAPPMCYYGGTPIAYAVAFSMTSIFAAVLPRVFGAANADKLKGLIDADDPRHACQLTGFLPVHVAVANGLIHMYDFITELKGLSKADQVAFIRARGDRFSTARRGTAHPEYCSLTPLQLATKLGDRRMFQHVLRKDSHVEWRWGPVTSYVLDLAPVDSCGPTGCDVMELLGRPDACHRTKTLLLQPFMQGFLHDLFVEKWRRFARHWWLMTVTFDLINYSLALLFAFYVKYELMSPRMQTRVPAIVICAGVPMLVTDLRACYLYYRNLSKRAGPGTRLADADEEIAPPITAVGMPTRVSMEHCAQLASDVADATAESTQRVAEVTVESTRRVYEVLNDVKDWVFYFNLHLKWAGQVAIWTSCVLVLTANDPLEAVAAAQAAPGVHPLASAANLERWADLSFDELAIIAHDPGGENATLSSELVDFLGAHGYPLYEDICVIIAFGIMCWTFSIISSIFLPIHRLGILVRAVLAMIFGDLTIWTVLLLASLVSFGMVVFLCYPVRIGRKVFGLATAFDSPITSLQSSLELALLGVNLELALTEPHPITGDPVLASYLTEATTATSVASVAFLFAYAIYAIFTLILLLNLLIAMMSTTYTSVLEDSVLAWRVDFARLVLRIELECEWLARPRRFVGRPWDLHAGERTADGRYIKKFRHVEKNTEGIEMAGSTAVFDELDT